MGKLLIRKWGSFFLVLMLAASVSMLTGCDGDDGAPGAQGPPGPPGADAPGADAGESCNVCHGVDAFVDVAVAHPMLEKPTVSDIEVSRAGDILTVTFTVTDPDGDPVEGIGLVAPSGSSDLRVYMADIVPAGTPTVNVQIGRAHV